MKMLSTRTTRLLKPIALTLALAALAVPTAQGKATLAGKYGQLDPWAYNLIHQSTQAVPFITDTLGGSGHPNKPAAQGYRLITDTLGGNGSAARSMRSYDPGAYVYGGASPAVARQIQVAGYGRPTPVASVTVVGRGLSFSWSDAGVGAGVAFAAMLLTVGVATLIMRRSRGRLAGF
jgi:hypothetical protein